MNEHARRTCRNVDGVYWKGSEVPCPYDGCAGIPALPPRFTPGCETYVAAEDPALQNGSASVRFVQGPAP